MKYGKKLSCGCRIEAVLAARCIVGTDLRMCPKHKAAEAMYEALKEIQDEGTRCLHEDMPVREIYAIDKVDRLARQALAQAEGSDG